MNAELFRELSIIAEDESLMAKMLKYAKKLTAKKADSTLKVLKSSTLQNIRKWMQW